MRAPRFRWIAIAAIFALIFVVGGAWTAFADNPNAGCNQTPYENPGNGANHSGAYDDTCDGSPSGNGNGDGNATGKPCAGCVGNADEKNPPGQAPDASDGNAGYECDTNNGIAKTNPAHTGCESVGGSEENPPGEEGSTPGAEVLGRHFLATTGSPVAAAFVMGMLFIMMGATIRFCAVKEPNA
jgi:hypothetical protein